MRRAVAYTNGTVHPLEGDAAIVAAMKAPEEVLWLDLERPDAADIALLRDGFGFHPLSLDDLAQTHNAAKLDEYDTYVFQVAMVPFRKGEDEVDLFELELFYLKGTLVTVHDRRWEPLESLWAAALEDPARELGRGAQIVYHNVIDRVVDEYFPLLDFIDERVEVLEQQVFASGSGRNQVLPSLFHLRRSVGQLVRAARNQRESVQRLASGNVRALRKETCYQFRDVYDHLILLHDSLDDHRESLGGLRDTYLGVIGNRMNEVMKSLTVFSAVMLPLAFVTGLWGMNVPVPFAERWWGFWAVLLACFAMSFGVLRVMSRRGWLRRFS